MNSQIRYISGHPDEKTRPFLEEMNSQIRYISGHPDEKTRPFLEESQLASSHPPLRRNISKAQPATPWMDGLIPTAAQTQAQPHPATTHRHHPVVKSSATSVIYAQHNRPEKKHVGGV